MRKYKNSDEQWVKNMLRAEGIPDDEMVFNEKETHIVDDIGFFTLTTAHSRPYLQHFCVDRIKRSPKAARLLLKSLARTVKGSLIITAKHAYLNVLIRYYFKKYPYAEKNGHKAYLVEVT